MIGLRIPGMKGRIVIARDMGEARVLGSQVFMGHLEAVVRDYRGRLKEIRDLGSGLVTNLGVMAMANDYAWASPSAASCATLALANYHATGTGSTAAAATDIALQTAAAPTATTAVAGTQTNSIGSGNAQAYKTSAQLNYTSTLAITEWGLFTAATLSATTGTPFTATTSSSGTVTSTPYTASSTSVRGEQQYIVVSGTVYGLIVSNTTSVLTIASSAAASWVKTADGTAGSTPASTAAFTLQPVMWDHRVFSALNVNNGDSITFNYTLTINSGG